MMRSRESARGRPPLHRGRPETTERGLTAPPGNVVPDERCARRGAISIGKTGASGGDADSSGEPLDRPPSRMTYFGHRTRTQYLTGRRRAMDIRSTLTELCEAFNAHDLDRIMAFFFDDCVDAEGKQAL